MAKLLKPDICVFGAGSGGLAVATAARAFNVSVVMVENRRLGGASLNAGCVPSKALIAAARRARDLRRTRQFGIAASDVQVDFHAVHDHVHETIASLESEASESHLRDLGIELVRAPARFFGPDIIEAGGFTIRPRRFVVATGSSPVIPPIPGIDDVKVHTSETIFSLRERPRHLAIIGAGPTGVELAQAYRRLGSTVTLIEIGRALYREDLELAEVALGSLRRDGVDLRQHTSITRIEKTTEGIRLHLETAGRGTTLDASHLLAAAGRRPSIAELGLETAGIDYSEHGIEVDDTLRSVSNSRVYAVGDVAGGPQFTHVAGYHAGLVLRPILFRLSAKVRPEIVPRVTHTDPEIAAVGMSEAQARLTGEPFRILRHDIADNDRARIERETEGFIKIVAGKGGKILGVGIVGRNAGELVHIWALALAQGLTLRDMTSYVAPYPTIGEIGKRAAVTYFEDTTRKTVIRGILEGLRIFG